MAESIAVHFFDAERSEVEEVLMELGLSKMSEQMLEANHWHYPYLENYIITTYPCDDIIDDYQESLEQFFKYFENTFPRSTLCIELRRSKGNVACDTACWLVVSLLQQLDGVVNDTYSDFWTLEEINNKTSKATGKFLDCYRGN